MTNFLYPYKNHTYKKGYNEEIKNVFFLIRGLSYASKLTRTLFEYFLKVIPKRRNRVTNTAQVKESFNFIHVILHRYC